MNEFLSRLPSWLFGVGLILFATTVGVQMYRGDALVCANGAIFQSECPDLRRSGAMGTLSNASYRDIHTEIALETAESPRGDYTCKAGYQMLNCRSLLYSSGNSICGHSIRTNTRGLQICTVGECTAAKAITPNGKWRVELTCAK